MADEILAADADDVDDDLDVSSVIDDAAAALDADDADAGTPDVAEALKALADEGMPDDDAEIAAKLRDTLPDLADMSDDDVMALWREAIPSTPYKSEHFKAFLGDEEIDFDKTSLRDFLEKAEIEYNALGRSHKKPFETVLRTAQVGHLNEARQAELQADIETLTRQLNSSRGEVDTYGQQAKVWDEIMRRASAGDTTLFDEAVRQFQNAPLAEAGPSPAEAELQARDVEQAGVQYWNQNIYPVVEQLAQTYGRGVDEVAQQVYAELEKIPAELYSEMRVHQLLTRDMPTLLGTSPIEAGATTPPPAVSPPTPSTATPSEASADDRGRDGESEDEAEGAALVESRSDDRWRG